MFPNHLLRAPLYWCAIICLLLLSAAVLPARAGFLYVLNDSSSGNAVYGYQVNETTGFLTPVPNSPLFMGIGSTSSYTERLTIDRANGRLFVINDGSDTVSVFYDQFHKGSAHAA